MATDNNNNNKLYRRIKTQISPFFLDCKNIAKNTIKGNSIAIFALILSFVTMYYQFFYETYAVKCIMLDSFPRDELEKEVISIRMAFANNGNQPAIVSDIVIHLNYKGTPITLDGHSMSNLHFELKWQIDSYNKGFVLKPGEIRNEFINFVYLDSEKKLNIIDRFVFTKETFTSPTIIFTMVNPKGDLYYSYHKLEDVIIFLHESKGKNTLGASYTRPHHSFDLSDR